MFAIFLCQKMCTWHMTREQCNCFYVFFKMCFSFLFLVFSKNVSLHTCHVSIVCIHLINFDQSFDLPFISHFSHFSMESQTKPMTRPGRSAQEGLLEVQDGHLTKPATSLRIPLLMSDIVYATCCKL